MIGAQHFRRVILSAAILPILTHADVRCEETSSATESARDAQQRDVAAEDTKEAKRLKRMRKLANSVQVYADLEGTKQATLVEIFRWTNPQRDTIGGAAFAWVFEGRPLATIGLWTYDDTAATDSYEMQSMSATPFSTTSAQWNTSLPGVKFRAIVNEKPPAETARRRLIQMRQLARKHFSATVYDRNGEWEPLRLLPTPVYRYTETPTDVLDGAMFSFAQGTDPEVFLILEARKVGEKQVWYYAFGNQTSGSTRAAVDGKQIWSSEESDPTFFFRMRRP